MVQQRPYPPWFELWCADCGMSAASFPLKAEPDSYMDELRALSRDERQRLLEGQFTEEPE